MLKACRAGPLPARMQPQGRGQQKGFQGQVVLRGQGVSLDKDVFLLGRNLHGWPCASHCHPAGCPWLAPSQKYQWAWPAAQSHFTGCCDWMPVKGRFLSGPRMLPWPGESKSSTGETWDISTVLWSAGGSGAVPLSRSGTVKAGSALRGEVGAEEEKEESCPRTLKPLSLCVI